MVESIDKLRNFSVCQKSLGEGNTDLPVQLKRQTTTDLHFTRPRESRSGFKNEIFIY